jgi:hypothetical protein
MDTDRHGCLFLFAAVGAGVLLLDWFLFGLFTAPVFCSVPSCATTATFLTWAGISTLVGISCVVLTAVITRVQPWLLPSAAVGAFAVATAAGTAVASGGPGLWIVPVLSIMLMTVPLAMLLVRGRN